MHHHTSLLFSFSIYFYRSLHYSNFAFRSNGSSQICKRKDCPDHRKLSFSQEPDHEPGPNFNVGTLLLHSDLLGNQISEEFIMEPNANGNIVVPLEPQIDKPELTCISEEGIADMDLPDNVFNNLDYIGDCITSCDKVSASLCLFLIHIADISTYLQYVWKTILKTNSDY